MPSPLPSGARHGRHALTTLASFDLTNGSGPFGTPTLDAQGNLYGTTSRGGAGGLGTVFRVDAGTDTLTTLIAFDGTKGNAPRDGPTLDAQGNIYGTTSGGRHGDLNGSPSTVFRLSPQSVPEPTSALMLAQGVLVLAGLLTHARRRRAARPVA